LRLNAGVGSISSDESLRGRPRHGFSLVELTAVLAVVATVAVVATPTLLAYWDSWSLQAGARELASVINLGRQLAISTRSPVCVDVSGAGVRFRIGGCTGDVWTGALTDASGAIRISDPATLAVSSNARLVFTTLGAASPAATFTLRHARTRASRTVVVAGSGRISVE
jgi:prepilin-type N-terminal cleavage/methylation domain-containing protein